MNSLDGIRCLRYIDDFVIIGKREPRVLKAFKTATELLNRKQLEVYTLNEANTKAAFGDIRRRAVDFLGCTISKGQIRPQDKSKDGLCVKIDALIRESLKEMRTTGGKCAVDLSYYNTIIKINNILKGWGGAFSFCSDKKYFELFDEMIMQKIRNYNNKCKFIISQTNCERKTRRILGLQMLVDCMVEDSIYGPTGSLVCDS